jgi:uncharacterized membrane protein YraQ (UPF0718 family)
MLPDTVRSVLLDQRVFALALALAFGVPLVLGTLGVPVDSPWSLLSAMGGLYVLARLLYGVALVAQASYAGVRSGYETGKQ